MSGLKAVLKRELAAYFNAPIAYVFAVVFLLVADGLFMTTFFLTGLCDMRGFFQTLPLLLVVFIPALTMRLWAEERKSGTISLLYSLPVSEINLVLGKFLAAYLFTLLTLASTLIIPVMLSVLGEPDLGPIIGGYLGASGVAAFLLALGLCLSAFFEDQIVAFIISLVAGLATLLTGTDLVSSSIDSWLPGVGTFLRSAMGLMVHYSDLAKGVIPVRDLIFYFSFTLVFLIINIWTIKGYLRYLHRQGFFIGVLFLIGIGLFGNATLANLRLPRFDLTEGKIYTVSPAARKVLEKLEVPIQVTYYVSSKDQLPTPMKNIARDVTDILSEFAALSPKFSFKVVDPTKNPELVSKLKEKGIVPFAVQTIERDQVSVRQIYSALSIAYLDKREEIIPQIVPQSLSTLEYDIISRIYKLTLSEPPVVALHTPSPSPNPFMPRQDRFQMVRELLKGSGFEVKGTPITQNAGIPEDAKLLIILEPEKLNDRQLYEIDHFLRSGHPVIVAAQAYKYSYGPGPNGEIAATPLSQPLSINKLLKAYGVEIDDRMLMDQQSAVLAISSERQMGLFVAVVRTPVRFPMQIKILPPQMNQDLSVTSQLSALLYLWGSALKLDRSLWKKEGLKGEVLFTSSPMSWLMPYRPGPLTPKDLRPGPKDEKGPKGLAVLLSGRFPKAFSSRPEWPGEKKGKDKKKAKDQKKTKGKEGAESEESKPSKLVVVGCGEMFTNSTIQAFSNAVFLVNLAESLILGNELLYIRAKTQVERYLPEVSDAQKLFWRVLVVFGPPTLWVMAGLSRAVYRRRRREKFWTRRAG